MTATNSSSRKCNGGGRIVEVVDEILSHDKNAAGLAINWQCFGSNGHEKADYSRGVLERFTKRAEKSHHPNHLCKTIFNPRKVNFIYNAHFVAYFDGDSYSVNECGGIVQEAFNEPVTADKIVVNHYHCKSWEEYSTKKSRGDVSRFNGDAYNLGLFKLFDCNEVFDDGILKYRNVRAENFSLEDDKHRVNRVINALVKNLSAYATDTPPVEKLETALTCRVLSSYLREKFPDVERMKLYEEVSLTAIINSLDNVQFWEARLLISELPNLLSLPHPAVKDLRDACRKLLSQLMNVMHLKNFWSYYVDFYYLQRLLKIFKE